MTLPKLDGNMLAWGVALAALFLWAQSKKDNNRDGAPDGLFSSLGYSAGRAPVDVAVGVFDGVLDALADPLGGSYADCQKHKRSGNKWGAIWACSPSEWENPFK